MGCIRAQLTAWYGQYGGCQVSEAPGEMGGGVVEMRGTVFSTTVSFAIVPENNAFPAVSIAIFPKKGVFITVSLTFFP